MRNKENSGVGSDVPFIAAKPPRRPFFDGHERGILGFELFLIIAAIFGAGIFGIVAVVVKSIKW